MTADKKDPNALTTPLFAAENFKNASASENFTFLNIISRLNGNYKIIATTSDPHWKTMEKPKTDLGFYHIDLHLDFTTPAQTLDIGLRRDGAAVCKTGAKGYIGEATPVFGTHCILTPDAGASKSRVAEVTKAIATGTHTELPIVKKPDGLLGVLLDILTPPDPKTLADIEGQFNPYDADKPKNPRPGN